MAVKLSGYSVTLDMKSQIETAKISEDKEALAYLTAKFPGVDKEVFFTDYRGTVSKHVIEAVSVCSAGQIEQTCSQCKGNECKLKDMSGKPVVSIQTSPGGFQYLDVRRSCGISCRYRRDDSDFERMFRDSGLLPSQRDMTFAGYNADNPELKEAKSYALEAAINGTNLVLSGKWGTGKTHLAVAVALTVMRQGRQAMFRLVSEMSDELRASNFTGDYYGLMKRFEQVPCLILDDLGKERVTDAGREYLYQIIDCRYRNSLQTIITTNAKSIEELSSWGRNEYIPPMISRLMQNGTWVTITRSSDYRMKRRVNVNVK